MMRMYSLKTINVNLLFKLAVLGLLLVAALWGGHAFATSPPTGDNGLGQLADNVTGSFASFGKLIIAIAYLAGIAFTLASIFKFKQHKDNPTQIPLGTPLALLVIGIVLVFLPAIFGPAGQTVFKDSGKPGSFTGEEATKLFDNSSTPP